MDRCIGKCVLNKPIFFHDAVTEFSGCTLDAVAETASSCCATLLSSPFGNSPSSQTRKSAMSNPAARSVSEALSSKWLET
jgi:hypothetical protein